ncbi:PRD domain-containing protein [Mesobacillus boroniphilus]|uniref:PRD domain-containing protein n=1 Tax=Mesobacillus boroniphilus TaxID=308892 RepID=A0A944GXG7_9BACI|nr:PRD domain-containing protein [Mesobacillus boroniphilus]MBS8265674.1 PRD domain-containing protein [Mesobacillus boroniphilus]
MYISARERQLLEILLTEKEEMTVKDLADKIGVSGRTVHRDLKNIEDILMEYELTLLKKSGVGVQISGSPEKIRQLELFLFNLFHTEYTPDERQTIILCELLETKGPVKLLGLANDLNVTIATVSADLSKLEDKLESFGLSLIRKRGYGVELEGDEAAKRRAMRNLISAYLDESEILSLARENIQKRSTQQTNTISERLLGLVERQKLLIVEKVVDSIIQELPFAMADSAYIGLVVHLALAIERIQKGEGIAINKAYMEDQQSSKEYKFAEKIVAQLEQVFQIEIPEAEVAYITMHLKGAKLRHDNEYLMEESSLQVALKAKHLIDQVEKVVGTDLSANRSLFEGLVMHLKPAMYRVKQGMGISNPLTGKVKKDYPELFSIVKQAAEQVFPEYHVPDEEVGYLVMHFGSAVLGRRELADFKTLVICSSGIGTSKMLVTRLQKEFPELKNVQNVSVMEFKKLKESDYQLVISTIPIPDYKDYIIVSPMLNKDEIEKIRSFINKYKIINSSDRSLPFSSQESLRTKNAKNFIEEMQTVQKYSETIAKLLMGFELVKIRERKTTDEILYQAVQELSRKQTVENIDLVADALKRREQLGGLGVPGTAMALFHARSPGVIQSSFTIYSLENPIITAGMDGSPMEVKFLLLMLSPEEPDEKTLEVLSHLSSLLIESEESTAIFESNDENQIASYLSTRFEQFFTEKIEHLRSV